MFTDIKRGLAKFFTPKFLLVLIISTIAIWGLMTYNGQMQMFRDTMEDGSNGQGQGQASQSEMKNEDPTMLGPLMNSNQGESVNGIKNVANALDLLPKKSNDELSALNPSNMNGAGIAMPDLLDAGYHIGLDSVGQSLRNANLQLRSDPPVNKMDVGPWNQSTITGGDTLRQQLEIGKPCM
jgi:hypothetical protein